MISFVLVFRHSIKSDNVIFMSSFDVNNDKLVTKKKGKHFNVASTQRLLDGVDGIVLTGVRREKVATLLFVSSLKRIFTAVSNHQFNS